MWRPGGLAKTVTDNVSSKPRPGQGGVMHSLGPAINAYTMPRAQWLSRTFSNTTLVPYRQEVGLAFLRAFARNRQSLALPKLAVLA